MNDDPLASGTALAAVVLQTQILHALIRTGVLPQKLVAAMMDIAIQSVEEMPRDKGFGPEVVAVARERLLSVQAMVEAAKPRG
ncbi:hypothetical protein HN018_19215 [Lichenicola cladoniae]|uniref:Uncharacterized protein n=1 Tax=Lichenicola cladoniae TaxID=1484109 RepID=A0A6M8HUP6_9PROT|nr:hypothetical protein [Lichenicola cladoniae]NPD68277.1 hypothetical protein [Acetobacteraceae bacterium]QKE91877.1 hypothetical protein HN018_19215 [Lichenicola cladoniae]